MISVAVLAVVTRPLFRFNQVAALITVYVSNPLTLVPIYWFNYKVGTVFIPGDVTREQFAGILKYSGFAEWWEAVVVLFVSVGEPLILGSLIVATVCSIPTYPIIHWLVERRHRPQCSENTDSKSVDETATESVSSGSE